MVARTGGGVVMAALYGGIERDQLSVIHHHHDEATALLWR